MCGGPHLADVAPGTNVPGHDDRSLSLVGEQGPSSLVHLLSCVALGISRQDRAGGGLELEQALGYVVVVRSRSVDAFLEEGMELRIPLELLALDEPQDLAVDIPLADLRIGSSCSMADELVGERSIGTVDQEREVGVLEN